MKIDNCKINIIRFLPINYKKGQKTRLTVEDFKILLINLILFVPFIYNSNAQIILEDSFESRTLDGKVWDVTWWAPGGQLHNGIKPEIVDSPVRYGKHAVKVSAQYNWKGVSNYTRTELTGKRNDTGNHHSFFYPSKENWIGFSVYLPKNWKTDHLSEELLFQLHGNQGDRSPSLGLYVDGENWYWHIRWGAKPNERKIDGKKNLWKDQYEKGEWVDFVIHAKWAYSEKGNGYLEIWKNGKSLFKHNGPNCYNDDLKIRGPQTGIYKWNWSEGKKFEVKERTMYLDEFRVGGSESTYNDVAPGVSRGKNQMKVTSLSDYTFIGSGYNYLTSPSAPASGIQTPFVPDLSNLSKLDLTYVSADGKGKGLLESDPASLLSVLQDGAHNKVIIALDGNYDVGNLMLQNISNVHIIAKNKGKAIITRKTGNTNFELGNSNVSVRNLSIIGFKAIGTKEGGSNFFIFGPGNGLNYNAYYIYFSDMEWSEYSCVVYGGLHSHDWTIDKSKFYNSTYEYIWYMMGWHHTVMNSVMYNNSYLGVVIRGNYPPDEEYIYKGKNELIRNRTEHFLDNNDWSHMIINNTFGSCNHFIEDHITNQHMGLWYDLPHYEKGRTEDCYFPPKNIIIANNAFFDNRKLKKVPILFAASRGINDPDKKNIASVNGVMIQNNYTNQKKLITPFDKTDMSSIDLSSNVKNFMNFGFDDKNRNYQLSPSSDLIDKGTKEFYFPNVDHEGNLRDHTPDIGAFEAVSKKL